MKMPGHAWALIAALALPWMAMDARAEETSATPLRIVVPFAPGGTPDVIARLVGGEIARQAGQSFVFENKPGAGGVIGTNYTIGLKNAGNDTVMFVDVAVSAITPSLRANLHYDFMRDLRPVSAIAKSPLFLVVGPNVPVSTLKEFIAYSKVNDKLNYGSPGTGGPHHLLTEYLKDKTGLVITHVPYDTSARLMNALMNGEIAAAFMGAPGVNMLKDSGHGIKILAAVGAARSPLMPEIPTFEEQGVTGFTHSALDIRIGLVAPASKSDARAARLNEAARAAIRQPEIVDRFKQLGLEAQPGSPDEFRALVQSDTQFFKAIAERLGLKLE